MTNEHYPFPTVDEAPGLRWDIKRTPAFQTIIHSSVSGKEQRARFRQYAIDDWELSYSRLLEGSEFATLIGFYKRMGGSFEDFLLMTPSDFAVIDQPLGVGAGAFVPSYDLIAVRSLGGYAEFVEDLVVTSVKIDGVEASPIWSVTSVNGGFNNNLHIEGTIVDGQSIVASFTYAWRVRFKEDTLAFNNFLSLLWEASSVKLMQVLI